MSLNANPTTITTSGGTSTITAVIAAGSHTIRSVDLYTGDTKVGEMSLSSGDYVYTVAPSETTTYTVKINYDEDKTVSPSTSVTVTVNLTLPSLTSLTASPTTIIESGGSSTITAIVDAGSYTISKVDLYTGTTKIGEMTHSSGSYTYSVTPSDTTVYKVRIYYGEVNPIIPDDTVTVTVDTVVVFNNIEYNRIGVVPADISTIVDPNHRYFWISYYLNKIPIPNLIDSNSVIPSGEYYYEMVTPSDYDPDTTVPTNRIFIGRTGTTLNTDPTDNTINNRNVFNAYLSFCPVLDNISAFYVRNSSNNIVPTGSTQTNAKPGTTNQEHVSDYAGKFVDTEHNIGRSLYINTNVYTNGEIIYNGNETWGIVAKLITWNETNHWKVSPIDDAYFNQFPTDSGDPDFMLFTFDSNNQVWIKVLSFSTIDMNVLMEEYPDTIFAATEYYFAIKLS